MSSEELVPFSELNVFICNIQPFDASENSKLAKLMAATEEARFTADV